jgi:hypothetical protein
MTDRRNIFRKLNGDRSMLYRRRDDLLVDAEDDLERGPGHALRDLQSLLRAAYGSGLALGGSTADFVATASAWTVRLFEAKRLGLARPASDGYRIAPLHPAVSTAFDQGDLTFDLAHYDDRQFIEVLAMVLTVPTYDVFVDDLRSAAPALLRSPLFSLFMSEQIDRSQRLASRTKAAEAPLEIDDLRPAIRQAIDESDFCFFAKGTELFRQAMRDAVLEPLLSTQLGRPDEKKVVLFLADIAKRAPTVDRAPLAAAILVEGGYPSPPPSSSGPSSSPFLA